MAKANGGNLSLKKIPLAAPQKDRLAANIGDHMGPKSQFGAPRPVMVSGGRAPAKKIKG